MKIDIEDLVIHTYDHETQTILKTTKIEFNVPFMQWIEQLIKSKDMKYVEDYTEFFQNSQTYHQNFDAISNEIFSLMIKNLDIEKADMAYIICDIESKPAIVGLKLNFETSYTHDKHFNKLSMKRYDAYPVKIKEAFIYYINTKLLYIAEKQFENDGKKQFYLSTYVLNSHNINKSNQSKIRTLKNAITKLNSDVYNDDLPAHLECVDNIVTLMTNESDITIQKILDNAYDDSFLKERLLDFLERKQIYTNDPIQINEKIIQTFNTKTFKNESGVKLKLTHEQLNSDDVELQQTADGTYQLIIKNITIG